MESHYVYYSISKYSIQYNTLKTRSKVFHCVIILYVIKHYTLEILFVIHTVHYYYYCCYSVTYYILLMEIVKYLLILSKLYAFLYVCMCVSC